MPPQFAHLFPDGSDSRTDFVKHMFSNGKGREPRGKGLGDRSPLASRRAPPSPLCGDG